jgi:hypothetical protein
MMLGNLSTVLKAAQQVDESVKLGDVVHRISLPLSMVGGTRSCGMSFQGTLRCRALALVGSRVVAIDDVWEMVRTSHVMIADSLSTRLNFGSLARDRTRSTPSSSSSLIRSSISKSCRSKIDNVSNAELEAPDSSSADLSIFLPCLQRSSMSASETVYDIITPNAKPSFGSGSLRFLFLAH